MPFFSIITPTLQRASLKKCCDSVDSQTFGDWEHLIAVDGGEYDTVLATWVRHAKRIPLFLPQRHNDFGNTPRHIACKSVCGEWVILLDDDNYFAHDRALQELAIALGEVPDSVGFCLAPILRFGSRFLMLPPGVCRTDSANLIVRREYADWPEGPEYTMDGIFAEKLALACDYAVFDRIDPIIVVPVQGKGE